MDRNDRWATEQEEEVISEPLLVLALTTDNIFTNKGCINS